MKNPFSVPKAMQEKYDDITAMTDAFCKESLNEEYAEMCRKLAAKLARKRPSPLKRGRTKTWASGIVHALCQVNFAFDRSQTPHIEARDIPPAFGVGKSTASNKAADIKKLLNISLMEPEWTLPSRMDDNPMAWYISVDGFIVDARSAPRAIQEVAYAKGLIPYIPE